MTESPEQVLNAAPVIRAVRARDGELTGYDVRQIGMTVVGSGWKNRSRRAHRCVGGACCCWLPPCSRPVTTWRSFRSFGRD